ncbi:MAG TPA: SRPBCC domain-containing protein, partial [Rhizomicrobium sp.]|nr:SRPBCC domain-containing protein [Rhizomicrobium sp.]
WGWAPSGKADTLVTLAFRARGGQTEVTLTHEGLPTPEDRENHGKGWNSTLNKLARYVKGETP